jgi:hypothetical protein
MTVFVPQDGEELALRNFLNQTAPQNQTLRLFATNVTPAETDVAGTYTEAAGGGYAAIGLTGANWTFGTTSPTVATYNAQQTFTFTGPLTTNPTVYGYYLTQTTSGILMWVETETPFTPANNGDEWRITPAINAD